MADDYDSSALYQEAFNVARNTGSFDYGWRKFRREFGDVDKATLRGIFDRVWDRGQRVRYMEDSNQGWFINRAKIGCPESGNRLFYTFQVTFRDEDGNQHEQFKHVNVPLEQRIGQNNQAAINEMIEQMSSSAYFRGWEFDAIQNQISNIDMVQVKCLTGGD